MFTNTTRDQTIIKSDEAHDNHSNHLIVRENLYGHKVCNFSTISEIHNTVYLMARKH